MRCLAQEPVLRPASAAEVAQELAAALPEAETLPLPTPPSQRATEIMAPSRSRARRRVRRSLRSRRSPSVRSGWSRRGDRDEPQRLDAATHDRSHR